MMRLVSYQSSRLRCKLAVPCRVIDFLYREALATALLDGILEPPFTRAKTMSCCQSTYPPGMLFIGRKRPSVCALGNYVLFQFYPVGDCCCTSLYRHSAVEAYTGWNYCCPVCNLLFVFTSGVDCFAAVQRLFSYIFHLVVAAGGYAECPPPSLRLGLPCTFKHD